MACVAVTILFGAGACTSAGANVASNNPGAEASTASVVSILRDMGGSMDYDTHDSPGVLASDATLTVLGTVTAVDDGRVFGVGPTRDTEPVFLNITLTVQVDRVLAGDASLVRDDAVYVELARTKITSVESVRNAIPAKQQVVLFLDDYSAGPGTFPLLEKSRPIPDGSTVFAPYADGFLLEDQASGDLVGGFVPLDDMPLAWREGTASTQSFITKNFPTS